MKKPLIIFLFLVTYQTVIGQNFDIDLLRNINLNRNQKLDSFFMGLSNTEEGISVLLPIGIYTAGLIKKDSLSKQHGMMMVGGLVINTIVTIGLKQSFRRARPFNQYDDIENLVEEDSYSFPSGHTSTAFTTATSLSLAYPKWYIIAPAYLWATSIGYSRLHLGVHYPSDVLIGALVGTGSAWLSSYLTKKIQHYRRRKKSL